MGESKHTPGPRTVESWEEASMFHAVVWGPDRVKVAHFTCDAFDAEAVAATLADAELDAAAPLMLEALRQIAGFVTRNSERAHKAHMQALAAQKSVIHDPTPGAGERASIVVTQAQSRHHEAARIFHTIEAILGPAIKAATGGEP